MEFLYSDIWLPFVKNITVDINTQYSNYFSPYNNSGLIFQMQTNRKYYSEESKQKYNIGNANL